MRDEVKLLLSLDEQIRKQSETVRSLSKHLGIRIRVPKWVTKGIEVNKARFFLDTGWWCVAVRDWGAERQLSEGELLGVLRGPGDVAELVRFMQRVLRWLDDREEGLERALQEMKRQQVRDEEFVEDMITAVVLAQDRR